MQPHRTIVHLLPVHQGKRLAWRHKHHAVGQEITKNLSGRYKVAALSLHVGALMGE